MAISSDRTSMAAAPPIAGKYRLIFELGRGGMADVMLAVIQGPGGFNKLQVLKLLRQELAAEAEFCTMFLEEARLSARINHPNVAQTNEVGFDGERYFIAMEYLEGQSLDELLRRGRSKGIHVPLPVVLRTLADACAGLHFAHELKDFDGKALHVIHRDVSPQNIFVTYDGLTKLLDFGIAKASDSNIRTQAGTIKGKIAYMAPEQLVGTAAVDRRADIFSLGAILWRSITGKRMWSGASEMEILQSLANHKIPEPIAVMGIPDDLVRICKKAISPNPNDRYPTAHALKVDLELLLATLHGGTHADVSASVNELFAERRQEIASAIDARLSTAEPMHLSGTRSVPRLEPSTGSMGSMPSSSREMSANYAAMQADGDTQPRTARGPRYLGIASAALIAAALVAGALILRPRANGSNASAAPSTLVENQQPHVAPSPPGDDTPKTDLVLDVTPANAQVYVDDLALPRSPHSLLPRDGKSHRVRAEADGYVTKTENVTFDTSSVRVGLSLEKEHRAWHATAGKSHSASTSSTPPAAAGTPAAPPSATTDSAPPPPPKPPRAGVDTIDKDDPWKK
ncbi:MAG TPA: serine/threonine-protein kinase [Polyangiaceae bacterium]|nr:serine/threonine-protein kinase [Polyangiaceae bacterium]